MLVTLESGRCPGGCECQQMITLNSGEAQHPGDVMMTAVRYLSNLAFGVCGPSYLILLAIVG
jgi:hypothetical protein